MSDESPEAKAAQAVKDAPSPNGDGPTEAKGDPAEHSPAEQRGHAELFRFSRYVHVGPGAEDCDEGENGSCANPLHFHAWCRLPNQFQHASIREKALAAKARKLRELRDKESDARTILDADVETLVAANDREAMIEEIAQKDFARDYMDAITEITQEEDGDFGHYEEDRERYRVLSEMSEEDRPEEEWKALDKHMSAFGDKLQLVFDEKQKPAKASLEELGTHELGDMLTEQRMDAIASQQFDKTYAQWEQYIGTMKPQSPDKPGMPSERYFGDVNHMGAAAPEVVEALIETFTEMDAEQGRALKNS